MLEEIFARLTVDEKDMVRGAFNTLNVLDIFGRAQRLDLNNVIDSGSDKQIDDSLAKEIREYRQRRTCLLSLREFGNSIQEQK